MSAVIVVVFALVLAELLVRSARPQWLARLAVRSMRVTRRFVLPGGPLGPVEAPGYRDGAVARRPAPLPPMPERMTVGRASLFRDGDGAFALVFAGDRQVRGFVVRIEAGLERGEIVLRARQAIGSPLPLLVVLGLALIVAHATGRVVESAFVAGLGLAVLAFIWSLAPLHRDAWTVAAMERIEDEARARLDAHEVEHELDLGGTPRG